MESRAVVIGPWNYADPDIPSHEEIRNSARKYAEVLASDPKWGENRVRSVTPQALSSINDVMTTVQRAADETTEGGTLLVIYVGHGARWRDVPGDQVHFAVESSRSREPHTWLSSWYVYRAIRMSKATLKVLIADCCYSNMLPDLGEGGEGGSLPGVLGEEDQGTCVLAAAKNNHEVPSEGCPQLRDEDLRACTPFSGHLINILRSGTKNHNNELTIGMIRDALRRDLAHCGTHDKPKIRLNDARESTPLFTNRMPESERYSPPSPVSAAEWAEVLKSESGIQLDQLFRDPRKAGEVVALLFGEPGSQRIALRVNERANQRFREPARFARYWAEARRALPA